MALSRRGMAVVGMVGSMALGLWLLSWTEKARKENLKVSAEFYKYHSLQQSNAQNEETKSVAALKAAIETDKDLAASLWFGRK